MICVILAFFIAGNLLAQDLVQQTQQLSDLQSRFAIEKGTLDSLRNQLNIRISRADDLKSRSDVDDDQVSSVMANALEIGKQVDRQRQKVNTIAGQIQQKRRFLYKYYSEQIDSLTTVLDETDDIQEQEKIRSALRDLNNQRIRVSPALPLFSFDPALVNKIEMDNSGNSTRNNIYRDYLNNALSEVDSNISILQDKTNEVRSMIRLNVRAREFMEDLNDAQMFSMLQVQDRDLLRLNSPSDGKELTYGRSNDINELRILYDKLLPVLGERYDMPRFNDVDSLLSDEYLELLEDTEGTLKLYRKMIEDKLSP
jgi:hypothetical protein